jgi:DnaJ-class molecular chaperone
LRLVLQFSRHRCEEMFKQIQSAYSLIGDEQSRRAYETRSPFLNPGGYGSSSNAFPRHQFRDESVDAFYRAFANAAKSSTHNAQFFGGKGSPFQTFTSDNVFAGRSFAKPTNFWNGGSLKSTFVQKVKVPLEDLYKGRNSVDFQVKDSIWKSYSAAFRGGFGFLILYQSLIFAAPLLRLSRLATLVFGGVVFHLHVPRPSVFQYTADILPGYKEGTKIIFRNAEPGFDMVFLLQEDAHERFRRVGNDLHTIVPILASQAKEGTTIEIETLDPVEPPIVVKIRRNEVKQSGDEVAVKGKGWPARKTGRPGDLVIHFKIVRKLSKSKKRSKQPS